MSSVSFGAAAAGMRLASTWLAVSANNVANVNTQGFEARSVRIAERALVGAAAVATPTAGPPDLGVEIPNLMLAGHMFKANAVTMHTATETYQDILRLKP